MEQYVTGTEDADENDEPHKLFYPKFMVQSYSPLSADASVPKCLNFILEGGTLKLSSG